MKKFLLLSIVSLFVFASCSKDDDMDGSMAGSYQGLIASVLTHGDYTISGSRCTMLDIIAGSGENEYYLDGYYGTTIQIIFDGDNFTIPTQEVTYEGISYSISGSGHKTEDGCYLSADATFYVDGVLWVKSEYGTLTKQ